MGKYAQRFPVEFFWIFAVSRAHWLRSSGNHWRLGRCNRTASRRSDDGRSDDGRNRIRCQPGRLGPGFRSARAHVAPYTNAMPGGTGANVAVTRIFAPAVKPVAAVSTLKPIVRSIADGAKPSSRSAVTTTTPPA